MALKVRVTPEQAADKWASRLGAATQEITQGVARVTEAPGQKAAAKFDKWLQGVQSNANKWRANVARVPLSDWQKSMTEIGIPRISQGAQQKKGKTLAFQQAFFPHLEAGMARIDAMPDTTLADRINRAVAMMNHNANFKRAG